MKNKKKKGMVDNILNEGDDDSEEEQKSEMNMNTDEQ